MISFAKLAAQHEFNRIQFEKGLTWKQIKTKAEALDKPIFIDFYATWCQPCKQMERSVYSNDTVVNFMNANFICVKVQVDTTDNDDSFVKNWYNDARDLKILYKINVFPSFVYLSSKGNLVHKDVGAKRVADFLQEAKNSFSSDAQYYTLLNAYLKGEVNFLRIPYIAAKAQSFNDTLLVRQLVRDYIGNYLNSLPDSCYFSTGNINFINTFLNLFKSTDRLFTLCYANPERTDLLVGKKRFSERIVEFIINKEEVAPALTVSNLDGHPKWQELQKSIEQKYNYEYARRAILRAKPDYYRKRKDWTNYTRAVVQEVDSLALGNIELNIWGAFYLNNNAWEIFQHSTNKYELERALYWSDLAINIDTVHLAAENMDTKANILYKLGKQNEAIRLEQKAASLSPGNIEIKKVLTKMKSGVPTW